MVSLCALAPSAGAQSAADSPAPVIPAPKAQITVDQDAAADAAPVNWSLRMKVYLKKLVSMQAFYEVVPGTISDHVRNFPTEWGRGGVGFADRLGSQYGQFFFSETIELAVSAFHKEDPRYFRMGQGNFFKRTGHAFKTAVVVSNTNGGQTIAVGQIAGVFGSWAVATQWWEPKSEQSVGQVMLWGGVGMATKAGANVFREFWPDAKRKFFKKHDP